MNRPLFQTGAAWDGSLEDGDFDGGGSGDSYGDSPGFAQAPPPAKTTNDPLFMKVVTESVGLTLHEGPGTGKTSWGPVRGEVVEVVAIQDGWAQLGGAHAGGWVCYNCPAGGPGGPWLAPVDSSAISGTRVGDTIDSSHFQVVYTPPDPNVPGDQGKLTYGPPAPPPGYSKAPNPAKKTADSSTNTMMANPLAQRPVDSPSEPSPHDESSPSRGWWIFGGLVAGAAALFYFFPLRGRR